MKIRNWDRWQSFRKDRGAPPWIKLHRCLMRNPEWVSLTDSQKGQLVSMWMLAADKHGDLPDDPGMIRKLCFLDDEPDLDLFTAKGFLVLTTTCQPDDNQAPPERPESHTESVDNVDNSTPEPTPKPQSKRDDSTRCTVLTTNNAVFDAPEESRVEESRVEESREDKAAALRAGSSDPWLTDDQAEHLRSLMARIHRRWPKQWGHVQALLGLCQRNATPWGVLQPALVSVLEHEPEQPGAYLHKILRVEEPNHHEAAAIEKAGEWKQAAAGLDQLIAAAQRAAGGATCPKSP